MQFIRLYKSYKKAFFIRRVNRFVLELELRGKRIYAHLPNTGRLYEFLEPGRPFYVVEMQRGKYPYKAVSVYFDDQFVFIDTIRVNFLFSLLIKSGVVDGLRCEYVSREYSIMNSRFDFFLKCGGVKTLVELKTCTLCYNGVGMFPDAPTVRGKRHIEDLHRLMDKGYSSHVIFLIPNYRATVFVPNYHVDIDYAKVFLQSEGVNFRAFKIRFTDPVTADASSLEEVPVDYTIVRRNAINKGSYVVLLRNDKLRRIHVGGLGEVVFRKGFYVYVGSALNSMDKRIRRHIKKTKRKYWHIDYLTDGEMKVFRIFSVRGNQSYEKEIAAGLMEICDDYIKGFGASDSCVESHLFYFYDKSSSLYPSVLNKVFLKILHYQTSSIF